MLKIAKYTRKITDLRNKAINALEDANIGVVLANNDNTGRIKIVFAGQYSAGKSSILKMLTGREDIQIGAGITTMKAHTYEWNGMEVVDTPGIHTEKRPDHDEISYKEIMSADMLVFVVTNELFDSHLADHFRKLAIDKDKAGEMILVVNKMERTSEGNTIEQQNVIIDDLCKVLQPYTPEQLNLCFLDAASYLESRAENTDPDIADELVNRSGYSDFIDTMNRFVEEKSISSKLTTELYQIDDSLEKAIHSMEPKSSDMDINALEENYLQQRHVLFTSMHQLQQDIKNVYTVAAAEIRNIGIDAANLLYEGCKQEEVEEELEIAIRRAEDITDKCQNDAVRILESRLTEMGQELNLIEDSEFTQQLKTNLSYKFESLPENIQKLIGGAGPSIQKAGQVVADKAYKAGIQGGLKLSNFSGSSVHDIVLKAGHTIGYKFKPWQAIKITKGVAIGGKVLGAFGVGFSVFMQIKADHDADKMSTDLKHDRQNIRSMFNASANELESYGKKFVNDNVLEVLQIPIQEVDDNIKEIRDSRKNRESACIKLEQLQGECQRLIQEIHTA